MRKTWQDYGREWLDTLVVAISVAMAFRAYFYEPFNIPTGSMRPTLYGNHFEPCEKPGVFDTAPVIRWVQWLFTGRDYKELKAGKASRLQLIPRRDGREQLVLKDAYGRVTESIAVPTDTPINPSVQLRRATGFNGAEASVSAGTVICRGYDVTGDFIFVNRWLWNWRKPHRGEVMIFSTTSDQLQANGLEAGTHYIKRMMGTPGEKLEISNGLLYVNGVETKYDKPVGARGEEPKMLVTAPEESVRLNDADWKRGVYQLKDDEYFAAGDNSYPANNSFDSRYWGGVPAENLRGVASIVFWPFNPRWGNIK